MGRKVRLRAPAGADEANYGTERFRVDNSGHVEVPEEAVPDLEKVGGFTREDAPAEVPEGMVRVVHGDDASSCSFGGQNYAAQDDGSFVVPLAALPQLIAHGFSVGPEWPADPDAGGGEGGPVSGDGDGTDGAGSDAGPGNASDQAPSDGADDADDQDGSAAAAEGHQQTEGPGQDPAAS